MEVQENFSSFDQPEVQPENNMTLAIVGTILGLCSPCCIGLILGIAAIYYSSQVSNNFVSGDYAGALSSSKNAKTLAYVAIGLGVLGLIFNIVFFAIAGMEGYREMFENYQNSLGD